VGLVLGTIQIIFIYGATLAVAISILASRWLLLLKFSDKTMILVPCAVHSDLISHFEQVSKVNVLGVEADVELTGLLNLNLTLIDI